MKMLHWITGVTDKIRNLNPYGTAKDTPINGKLYKAGRELHREDIPQSPNFARG